MVIDLPSVTWTSASELYPYQGIAPFTDDLDSVIPGICGAKTVILDPSSSTANFLSLSSNEDPLIFEYDSNAVTESDIGIHTVNYSV